MRLLLLNYEYPPIGGGASYASRDLARLFAARGHEVLVITSAWRGQPQREIDGGVELWRVPALRRLQGRSSFAQMAAYLMAAMPVAFLRCLRRKPDIILSFFLLPTGAMGAKLAWLFGVPHVISLRGGDVPSFTPAETGRVFRLLMPAANLIGRHAAAIYAVSEDLAQMARNDFPRFADQIGCIPNGVLPMREPDEKPGPARFLFAGRLSVQKNLPFVMRALARVRGDWRLDIAGEGPLGDELAALAQTLGIADRVTFHGWLSHDDVFILMRRAHFLLLCSNAEGMSMAALQGLAHGLPVVGLRTPGLRAFIDEGETGRLVDPGDDDALTAVLQEIVDDPGLSSRMAPHCLRVVREKYDVTRSADKYLRVFHQLTGK